MSKPTKYNVRRSFTLDEVTDKHCQEMADHLSVPMSVIIRMLIKEKYNSMKKFDVVETA